MAELNELRSRSITLIKGYVRGVDRKPNRVKVKTPFKRLAVAINTYYPEFRGRGFFDHDLVLKLCWAIAQGRQTQIKGTSRGVLTLEELGAQWQAGWESDDHDDPSNNSIFQELLVLEKAEIVVQIIGLPYHREGGPAPYNDDDTLEILVPEPLADSVIAAVRMAATQAGAKVKELEGVA